MRTVSALSIVVGWLFVGCVDNEMKSSHNVTSKVSYTDERTSLDAKFLKTKKLYEKCASCHGLSAEKKALGRSSVIKNWSKERIHEALLGYKNGQYGGEMKALMKGQVANLNEGQLQALSAYMSTL